jgi:hypothetical protein
MLLQHFPSVDYVKKKERKKKKKEEEMTHGNKMNLFLSNPLKMIEACVYMSLLYHRTMPSYLTCSYMSVVFFF